MQQCFLAKQALHPDSAEQRLCLLVVPLHQPANRCLDSSLLELGLLLL